MNKFYVYTVKSDSPDERNCVYVDEGSIQGFALHQFEPAHMEYSGVMVEADSPHDAHEVYNTFGKSGEIMWVDEPIFTVKKRQAFEARRKMAKSSIKSLQDALSKAEQAASRLAIHAYARGISMDLIRINERLSRMADTVRKISPDNPEVTTQELYERLKRQYIKTLTEYQYDNGSSPGGPPQGAA